MKRTIKKVAKVIKANKTRDLPYNVSMKVMGRVYNSQGKTCQEAIEKLQIKSVKGIGILTIEHGTQRMEKILSHIIVNRLFNLSATMRQIALKQLTFGI